MEKKKILMVDDEPRFGRMVQMILEASGKYEVKIESRGSMALATSRSFRPDLVLLDIMMPDMDGSEVASKFKEDPVLRSTPVILLTGVVAKGETEPGTKISGYPILAKPVSAEEILQAIEQTLKKK